MLLVSTPKDCVTDVLEDRKIGVIGAGNMGSSLVRGLLDGGRVLPSLITAVDPREEVLEPLRILGVNVGAEPSLAVHGQDLVVLGIKPQSAEQVLHSIAPELQSDQVVVSIMAGVSTDVIVGALAKPQPVVRVMPQILVLLRVAASALAAGRHATDDQVQLVEELFNEVGTTVVVDEHQMDAVTGLSGSGPAYVYTIIEALADGGVRMGLPREAALKLAAQTVSGAARMVLQSGEHPAQLKDRVTSPGGTTIAGLHALEKGGLRETLMNAVQAATNRSIELGKS
jgi:pyrroline-5-carboxylate reductase